MLVYIGLLLLICLDSIFAFELGRRWQRGRQELKEERAREAYERRPRSRHSTIRMRR